MGKKAVFFWKNSVSSISTANSINYDTLLVLGETKDQPTTSRPNTLSDDADDLQRQLDNEVRERLQFGRVRIQTVNKRRYSIKTNLA